MEEEGIARLAPGADEDESKAAEPDLTMTSSSEEEEESGSENGARVSYPLTTTEGTC